MQQQTLPAHLGRPVIVDLCQPCQSIWFDPHESMSLTPGATLTLFRLIGERVTRPQTTNADLAKCPRCHARLRRTHDLQRTTKFEYLRCPNGHGRLTTFFDFLREKDFIRPLTPEQIAELRQNVQSVHCSNCGATIDLMRESSCNHCGTPLSMLDVGQARRLVQQLQHAEDRTSGPVDPSLPLELARARRDVDLAFGAVTGDAAWFQSVSVDGLVGAGLAAMARWLRGTSDS